MAATKKKHNGLISSLTRLFQLLIRMRYLSADDVPFPPHTSPAIDVPLLQKVGFDEDVIDLMQVLPALQPRVTWGWQMKATQTAPQTILAIYLNPDPGPGDEVISFIRSGGPDGGYYYWATDAQLLPPWMFRLTTCENWGVNLLYNAKDASITEWKPVYNRLWQDVPSRPAEAVISEMIGRFETLEWVPYYVPTDGGDDEPCTREVVENPLIHETRPWEGGQILRLNDIQAALAIVKTEIGQRAVVSISQRLNRYIALRRLYRTYGRGSQDDFDGNGFESKRLKLLTFVERLENDKIVMMEGAEQAWQAFWAKQAGDQAV
ncbi:hypothetical protein TruAng_000230 [Truncatella angustata]|nr:hypothetical protein TruAng_000230 [Truncatella angustata]